MAVNKGNILLVNPWIVDFAAYDLWIKPIGLLIIGSVLKENGYDVTLFDCMDRNHPLLTLYPNTSKLKSKHDGRGHFYKEFIPKPAVLKTVPRRFGRYGLPLNLVKKELERFPTPDMIFITSGMTYWYPGAVEMISLLKRLFKGSPVILGGIYATLFPEHAKRVSGADDVVVGEGVIEGLKIADAITENHSDVGQYQFFEDLPSPLYDGYTRLSSVALLTSWGCPYQCPFCASKLLRKRYQKRNPLICVDEIEKFYREKEVCEFAFYDDALLFDKENHFIPILEELIDRKIRVHFHLPNGIQPGAIDQRTAMLMKKAGFQTVRLSYETKNKERQADMGFKVKDEDLINAVNHLNRAGFDQSEMGSYVLMGLPGQTLDEVIESVLFVLKLGVKVNLASFSPIPGTTCWQDAVDLEIMSDDIDPLLTNSSVFPLLSKTIRYEKWCQLKTLVTFANELLDHRIDPLDHSDFLNAMDKLQVHHQSFKFGKFQ
ncbi:cobalamin-dependent protein [bacterium]|nr:cobalamin-dependent protein [bacterium]